MLFFTAIIILPVVFGAYVNNHSTSATDAVLPTSSVYPTPVSTLAYMLPTSALKPVVSTTVAALNDGSQSPKSTKAVKTLKTKEHSKAPENSPSPKSTSKAPENSPCPESTTVTSSFTTSLPASDSKEMPHYGYGYNPSTSDVKPNGTSSVAPEMTTVPKNIYESNGMINKISAVFVLLATVILS